MTDKDLHALGARQRRMLEVVWQKKGATVQEVLEEINSTSGEEPLAYTTVLTTLQKLEKAGWLTHQRSEEHLRAYVYTPTRSRGEAIGAALKHFADTFLDGSKTLLFRHFVDQTDLTEEEFDEIRDMIRERGGPQS